ncbi:MAG: hypothetical protein IID12_09665, partial [Candidatus Marinimicrobia bacterium]|nr:hypothetical protein [Candidatus Neomarinimicrobiota bacterium]
MNKKTEGNDSRGMERREFLRWMELGAGALAFTLSTPMKLLSAVNPGENPLAGSVNRGW